ncbi:MAG: hypothetical protein V8T39_05760 [Streptococcus lutetiensis]
MRQEVQSNCLTTNTLKEFGNKLIDIMNRLEMTNHAIDGLEFAWGKDRTTFDWVAKKFLSTTYEQNQQINKLLSDVSFALLECDNEKELEGLKS